MDRYTDAYTWDAGRDDNDRQATLLWVSPGEIRYPAAVIAGMPLILWALFGHGERGGHWEIKGMTIKGNKQTSEKILWNIGTLLYCPDILGWI